MYPRIRYWVLGTCNGSTGFGAAYEILSTLRATRGLPLQVSLCKFPLVEDSNLGIPYTPQDPNSDT